MAAIESLLRERTGQGVPTVGVIDDVDGFGALRGEWSDLLRNSNTDNPFLSWEWLHAWWTHLGESRRLHILTVRDDDGRLVGVAPLCGSRGRWPWLSQLEFLATGWAGSDYLDLIVRRGYEDDCRDAFTGWLRSRGQTVRFDHLRSDAFAATLGDQLISSGWGREAARSGICPFATLQGHSWESYVETLRPSQRTRCRRYLEHASSQVRGQLRAREDGIRAARGSVGADGLSRAAMDSSWRLDSVSDAGAASVPSRRDVAGRSKPDGFGSLPCA